jgi:restriction system protein
MPTSAWMARAGNDNELAGELVQHNVVAVGWNAVGDLSDLSSRQAIKKRYAEAHPDQSKYRRAQNAGQLFRFAHKISEGDFVLTYLKAERQYRVGRVTGPYAHRPELFDHYPHVRPVDWLGLISRDDFSAPARNSLGSTLTVFSLDDYGDEIQALLSGEVPAEDEVEEKEEETPPFVEEVQAQADELIADLIVQLDPFDFEELVAGLLRAMGFEARTTQSGADHGIDVIAHKDAFGFEPPYVKVQVKRVSSTIGAADMRSFLGTLQNGESGLYVSTGGFTNSAREEVRHSSVSVRLLDRDDFIDLFLQHYDDLESEYKSWIPLRRIWVPTTA